jgi:hypothetical protein
MSRGQSKGSMRIKSRGRGVVFASLAIVASPLVKRGSRMGLYKLERYSHEGYLIKVVVLAVAGRSLDMGEPNPIHGLITIMI